MAKKLTKEPVACEEPAPKEVGGVWPFRPGSAMLRCFMLCLRGITADEFEAEFAKDGALYGVASHDFMLARMKRGRPGRRKIEQSHSWDFDTNYHAGVYTHKISNVRYLLGKKAGGEHQGHKAPEGSIVRGTLVAILKLGPYGFLKYSK